MKANPILLAITTVSLATPAMMQSAQSGGTGEERLVKTEDAIPRAGLVTVIEHVGHERRDPQWRIAWKSLTALPVAERERLRDLVRDVDRANRARAPLGVQRIDHDILLPPACMADQI